MNNLRLIRIFELRGKIHPMEQYIIGILDGIEEVKFGNNIEYRKDNKLSFNYSFDNNNIWLSFHLSREFKTNFGCSYEETKEVIKYLLEKHLKLTINEIY